MNQHVLMVECVKDLTIVIVLLVLGKTIVKKVWMFMYGYIKYCNVIDIPECLENLDNCQPPSVCHNTVGSYICKCPDGYMLAYDGRSCIGNKICLHFVL